MKKEQNIIQLVKSIIFSEVFKYLFFGVLTTVVYLIIRSISFAIFSDATISATIANILSILFAFVTNDRYVFVQERRGWFKRLVQFFIARLGTFFLDILLAWYLVQANPHLIGQFVGDNRTIINFIEMLFAQVLIIVLNYIISKCLIFKDDKSN